MSALASTAAFSAQVAIELRLPGRTVEASQLGPDFLILSEPMNHPPCEAIVVLAVDKNERLCPVLLPQGISSASPNVALARVEENAAVAA